MKYEIIKQLKEKNDYISGEALGKLFNVSRTAIWKAVASLKKEGYNIESVTNKGYILTGEGADIINEFEIKNGLKADIIGSKVYCRDTVSSVLDEAKKMLSKNTACDGTVITALCQTKGRGRLGRMWHTAPGEGVYMAVVLTAYIEPGAASVVTLLTGMAVANALKRAAGFDCGVKWPNDVMANGKKICGILTETVITGEQVQYMVAGIGVNVLTEKFPEELDGIATSVYLETGRRVSRAVIIREILEEIELIYDEYRNTHSFLEHLARYKEMCVTLSERVRVKFRNEEIEGIAADISETGELIIERPSGEQIKVNSGEVTICKKQY